MRYLKKVLSKVQRILKKTVIKLRCLLPLFAQVKLFKLPAGITKTIDYCKSQDCSFLWLRSNEKASRIFPQTPEAEVHWKFCLEHEQLHNHPNVWLAHLENAYVVDSSAHVLTSERLFLTDASKELALNNPIQSSLFQDYIALPRSRFLSGTSTVLCGPGANGYFHWLTDALPRISILLQANFNLREIDRFLIPENNLPAIAESLSLLGIGSSLCQTVSHEKCFRLENLILPSLPGASGNPTAWSREFLRNSFLTFSETVPDRFPKCFYISRKESRCVANEDEIVPVLREYGIEIIQPEKLSFIEQVALFARAELVVAPHGAALTNLMFSSSGTSVIELFSPGYVNVCFWAISNLGSLRYSYLIGEGEKYPQGFDPQLNRENIVVSADRLRSWLKHWT